MAELKGDQAEHAGAAIFLRREIVYGSVVIKFGSVDFVC